MEILRNDGFIFNGGFGFVAKDIMVDRSLSVEAKCLYAYISSFGGHGNGSLNSFSVIASDLNMTEVTINKALAELVLKEILQISC